MKLFYWDTLATCANYGPGHAVVMAANEREARNLLGEALLEWAKEHRAWVFEHGDEEEDEEIRHKIATDKLSKINKIIDKKSAIIIRGSE